MDNLDIQEQLNRHLAFLDQDENNLSLLVKISDLCLELGDLQEAQNYLDKASAINRIACLGHQGLLHLNQGQLPQAKDSFLEALSHEDTPALRYNLGFTHFLNSDLTEAWEVLTPLLEDEHYPEAKLLLARISYGQSEMDTALNLLQDVLTHNPDDVEALGLLSLLHFDRDEGELAIQTSLRTLALNPENYDANLVHVMSRLATQEATVEEIEHLLEINPRDSRLWFALGSVHMSQGTLDLAENTLNKAIEIYPEFYDCHIALGWCQLLKDLLNEAQQTYQTAADLFPELSDAWGGLALVHVLKEDFLRAEQFIKKAEALNSDCFLTEIAESIYFNHRNPKKAKEHLITALKNTKVPVSEKLAFIIEEMQGQDQLH